MSWDIFIAHSQADAQEAEDLHDLLLPHCEVFLDSRSLLPGDPWSRAIAEAQRNARITVVLVSSKTERAYYVHEEVLAAVKMARRPQSRHRVVPIYLDDGIDEVDAGTYGLRGLQGIEAERAGGLPGVMQKLLELLARLERLSGKTRDPLPRKQADTENARRQLRKAYEEKKRLALKGQSTQEQVERIIVLKRVIREGGRLQVGDRLGDGRFELCDIIGQGGFATVWRTYDHRVGRVVALKALHGQWTRDESRIERFFRGARKMAQLDHPAIVRVHLPHGREDGFCFFVMEHLPGGDLRRAVCQRTRSKEEALGFVLEVGEALHFAHERGVVHRDVKPANILLTSSGGAKLTDFDLVWANDTTGGTRTGGLGTYIFSAPEAMTDAQNVAPSADTYSLGMTALFVLSRGELNVIQVFRDLPGFLDRLHCPRNLAAALCRAVAVEPSRRHPSIWSFCEELRSSIGQYDDDSHQPFRSPLPALRAQLRSLRTTAVGPIATKDAVEPLLPEFHADAGCFPTALRGVPLMGSEERAILLQYCLLAEVRWHYVFGKPKRNCQLEQSAIFGVSEDALRKRAARVLRHLGAKCRVRDVRFAD